MLKMFSIFTVHPHSVGETYLQHMFRGTQCSVFIVACGLACFIHAFFPFMFVHTTSNGLEYIIKRFIPDD